MLGDPIGDYILLDVFEKTCFPAKLCLVEMPGSLSLFVEAAVSGYTIPNGNPTCIDLRLLGVIMSPPSLSLTAPKLFVVRFNWHVVSRDFL